MNPEKKLAKILGEYNSIARSRTRWVRNRKNLRNEWKELYQILEEMSGRNPGKLTVFDPVWHQRTNKAGVRGTGNRPLDQISALKDPVVKVAEPAKKPAAKKAPVKKAEVAVKPKAE